MKKMTMNLIAPIAMLALVIAPLAGSAANLTTMSLKANVPFAFSVSGKTMPAGEYSLNEQSVRNVLVVRNFEQKTAAGVQVRVVEGKSTVKQSRLEFRRYGSEYFLATIWLKGDTRGVEIPRSAKERKAAAELKNIAGLQAQPELIVVNATEAE